MRPSLMERRPAEQTITERRSAKAPSTGFMVLGIVLVGLAFVWSYQHTLVDLAQLWSTYPDYSHGYLVPPLAALLLWMRRDRFPGAARGFSWWGLSLIALGGAARMVAAWGNFDTLAAWSIPIWLGGVTWLFLGGRVARWSAPALAFLVFMAPVPFRIETALSEPLRQMTVQASCFVLQCLGQPALAEGGAILLGSERLEIEQACVGARVLLGVTALAYACAVLLGRAAWERLTLLAAAIPVAVSANVLRITVTGILYQSVSSEAGRGFAHQFAGLAMLPLAALLFGLAVVYLRFLVRDAAPVDVRCLIPPRAVASPR